MIGNLVKHIIQQIPLAMGNRFTRILLLLLISSHSIAQTSFNELVSSANLNLKERNYKAAADQFKKALEIQPDDTFALQGVIKCYTLSEDYKNAQRYADIALGKFPTYPEFHLLQGIIYNLKGNHEEAISAFSHALELKPSNRTSVQILMNRASAEIRLDNFTDALADYNAAMELDPRNTSIYTYRGLVNFRLGFYIDAVNDYTNAIDLEPNSALTYYNRGMTYLKLSEKQKACADFHMACKLGDMNACKMILTECGGR